MIQEDRLSTLEFLEYTPLVILDDDTIIGFKSKENIIAVDKDGNITELSYSPRWIGEYSIDRTITGNRLYAYRTETDISINIHSFDKVPGTKDILYDNLMSLGKQGISISIHYERLDGPMRTVFRNYLRR